MKNKISVLIIFIFLFSIFSIINVHALNVEGLEKVYSFKYGKSNFKGADAEAHFFGKNILLINNNANEANAKVYDYSGKMLSKSNEIGFAGYYPHYYQARGLYFINNYYYLLFNNCFVIYDQNYNYKLTIDEGGVLYNDKIVVWDYDQSGNIEKYYYYDDDFNKKLLDSSDPIYENFDSNVIYDYNPEGNLILYNEQCGWFEDTYFCEKDYKDGYKFRINEFYSTDELFTPSVKIYDSNGNLVKELFSKVNARIFNVDFKDNKILVNYAYYDGIAAQEPDYYDNYYYDYSSTKHLYVDIYDITKDYADKVILKLSSEKYKNLKNFFPDFGDDIKWYISDDSILKIENNNIIPLKVGETEIIGSDSNRSYKLKVVVVAEDLMNNPNTHSNLIPIIIILIIGSGYFVYYKKKIKQIQG